MPAVHLHNSISTSTLKLQMVTSLTRFLVCSWCWHLQEDLLRDLDKEFESWNKERKARKQARGGSSSSSSEPKSLLEELGMLGEVGEQLS
jgi:hypothetical protein